MSIEGVHTIRVIAPEGQAATVNVIAPVQRIAFPVEVVKTVRVNVPGLRGSSAYEIAVANGFDGTLEEWLASLQGEDGDPGASAYQVAVANGFGGTEAEWLASLKGDDGDDGDDGVPAEFRRSGGWLQWRLVGAPDWIDLVALTDIEGPAGPAIELQRTATHIQWRVVGAPAWIDLIPLDDLKGSDANVTQENIEAALGYTPADEDDLNSLSAVVAAIRQAALSLEYGGGLKLHPFHGTTSGARQSLQVVQNRLYFQLGRPIGPVRVTNPHIEVNTGQASATARAGICEWDSVNNLPVALVADWGTADCSSGGTKSFTLGTATADLDPNKVYAILFVVGGAATGATLYYQPFSPSGAPMFLLGTSLMILGIYDSGNNSTQRTSGFTNPVTLVGSVATEATANAPGQRNFVIFDVIPIPTP